ncbi:MAG: AAA family ATPase [Clostridia bacterium]|nr:AAA family ATPase [Clostridia bacterium]
MQQTRSYEAELLEEQKYTARVLSYLTGAISRMDNSTLMKDETIRMILADAWDELRMKPTALSPQELEQLSMEINRFVAQRQLTSDRAESYRKMLKNPYFARIDFQENGEEPEKIVIGLYSLRTSQGEILVHDWRAPVCSLYYDALPGEAHFMSPSGIVRGWLRLKRQYRMNDGKLVFFADTDESVYDQMLLEMLAGNSASHMKQIVSTIQSEQNKAIRYDQGHCMTVTGSAGSGKTSVAMHRAAYLLYHHRDTLASKTICVLSPTNAFIEYISTVLPDLGEENTQATTLAGLVEKILGKKVESPILQSERLMSGDNELRLQSVRSKADARIIDALDQTIRRFSNIGPDFEDIILDGSIFISKAELYRLYHEDLKRLTPAQRLNRIKIMLEQRLEDISEKLYSNYKQQMQGHYGLNRELDFATKLAVAQKLRPIRAAINDVVTIDPSALYARALSNWPKAIREAATENANAGLIWYEDAPGIAYLAVRLGLAKPDTNMRVLLVDEAQDYADIAFKLMNAYFPNAGVTLLGDANQRTLPGLPECHPGNWGALFGCPDAPHMRLTKGYRFTMEIARLCDIFLYGEKAAQICAQESVGRHGPEPLQLIYDPYLLRTTVADFQKTGAKRIGIITRTHAQARCVADMFKKAFLLTGDINELEDTGVTVGCLTSVKGLEFDAVAVLWDMSQRDEPGENRRLYTACSRALHRLAVFDLSDHEV